MKKSLYPRLALTGMRKNRRLYIPYILSCIGMVMMYFIIHSVSCSPLLAETKGGNNIQMILSIGKFVIAAFGLLFLLYTNSFLTRRRLKEFGLYSVLGMDRRGLKRIVFWESLFVAFLALLGGTALGIALSKLGELGLLNTIQADIDYRFTVSAEAVLWTLVLFGIIFLILMLRNIIQVRKYRPLELMRNARAGEKPPKANRAIAVLGALMLIAAYAISLSIQNPLSALMLFFVAVIMVIAATYMLFMSGSVALCGALRKNRAYYYKKQHFVSVSSMAYRMKRNGAGLASICILSTMVLVMISSTSSLYFGAEDAIATRFPQQTNFTVNVNGSENINSTQTDRIRAALEEPAREIAFEPQNVCELRYAEISGILSGADMNTNADVDGFGINYNNLRTLMLVSADDYARAGGASVKLSPGECAVIPIRCSYSQDRLNINDISLAVKKASAATYDLPSGGHAVFSANAAMPSLVVVIPDYETVAPLNSLTDFSGRPQLIYRYYFGYDYQPQLDDETAVGLYRKQLDALRAVDFLHQGHGADFNSGCLAAERSDFYSTFGSMFFLGIMLSVVFIFAAAVIIYYKQVTEGYEDQGRYAIMRKVGMTAEDIRRSVNSQILTVFFAPLLMAGVHLAFAFPVVWRLLQLFSLSNLGLAVFVTVCAFLVFGVFYILIYRATAKAYISIISAIPNK